MSFLNYFRRYPVVKCEDHCPPPSRWSTVSSSPHSNQATRPPPPSPAHTGGSSLQVQQALSTCSSLPSSPSSQPKLTYSQVPSRKCFLLLRIKISSPHELPPVLGVPALFSTSSCSASFSSFFPFSLQTKYR